MPETYRSHAEADADRTHLARLHVALNAAHNTLRLDACRTWTLQGRRGSAATWGDGETWMLIIRCRSALAWTWAKKRLAFAEVTQDGDDEGVLRLHRLPSPAEAAEIRDLLGIWQTRPPEMALRFTSLKQAVLAG